MTDSTRIALIHATRLAIDPIVSAFDEHWPEAEYISVLDESLSIDRQKDTHLTDELSKRIVSLSHYAQGLGSAGILYTCSAFGEAIQTAKEAAAIPVLKPNEAMFEKALSLGTRVAMIYNFPSSVQGMEQEFHEEAARLGVSATLQSTNADGSRSAMDNNDAETHNRIIANTAASLQNVDVIVLAHFSMAPAADAVRKLSDVPVLTSTETAIEKLQRVLQHS